MTRRGPAQRPTCVREAIAAADRVLTIAPEHVAAIVDKISLFRLRAQLPQIRRRRSDALMKRAAELRAK